MAEYGVSINVHRSGKIRRIAIGAARVAADELGAVVRGRSTVRVGRRDADVANWIHTRFPDASIRPLGVRHVVSFENGASDVTPRELFDVAPRFTESDATIVESKHFTAGYPVDAATAEPTLWPEPGAIPPEAQAQTTPSTSTCAAFGSMPSASVDFSNA
jgi:hypothetical protein